MSRRSIGHRGFALIQRHEGLRLAAYPDPGTGGAPWTIGYGHTRGVTQGMVITRAEAEHFLLADIDEAIRTIYAHVPASVIDGLPQACFDALVSFVFNVGVQAFVSPRTGNRTNFWRALTGPDPVEVARNMQLWVKGGGRVLPGLVARRGEEAALWGLGLESAAAPHPTAIEEVAVTQSGSTPQPPRQSPPPSATPVAVGAGAAGTAVVATTLTSAGQSMAMSQDRIALVLGLVLILIGAGVMLWIARH
jgi:lysozyme